MFKYLDYLALTHRKLCIDMAQAEELNTQVTIKIDDFDGSDLTRINHDN